MPKRARRLLTPLAACALALVATAPAAAAPPAPAPLLLRLPDPGPGYRLNYMPADGTCRPLRLSDDAARSALVNVAHRFPHRGCEIVFERIWTTPGIPAGPRYVWSVAFAFEDPEGPEAALARPRAVAALVSGGLSPSAFELADTAPAIGDEAFTLRAEATLTPQFDEYQTTSVVWRSGRVLGVVMAFRPRGGGYPDVQAQQLAAAQQARIANPTPLLRSDNDDTEAWLDDPRLGVPIVWLGRHVPANSGRPAISLLDADRAVPERATPRAHLEYGTPSQATNLSLSLWRPSTLRRLLRQERLDRVCRRRYSSSLDGVRATIVGYHGFDALRRAPCPRRPPDTFEAVAFFRGVAVTIDADTCPDCKPRAAGSYSSVAGMRALLRALRPRRAEP